MMDDLVKRLREHKMRDNEMPNHYVRRLLIDRMETAAALEAKDAEIARLIELGDKLADAAESGGKVANAIAAWDQLRNTVSRAALQSKD